MFDALATAGAGDVDGLQFYFSDEAALRRAARADAVRAAGAQAAEYAAALGKRLGRVLRVSERSAREGGGPDIVVTAQGVRGTTVQPSEQEVSVTVWIDYALVD